MTLKVSVGFKAWLGTTDDSRPLSDYRTVLEGTIIQIAQLEDELQQLKEDCKPFRAQIDQAKTYKVNVHSLNKTLGGE